jgi:hypothetical protein
MKDKWATQSMAMIDGVSTAKAARRCDVHYTTAFRWRHRFLAALAGDKPKALSGIVEGDETFILESFKGNSFWNRSRAIHSGIVQGQAVGPAAKVAQERR